MATGQVTVAAAPSYLGQLFQMNKRPNTVLRLLGGFQGGILTTTSVEFPIGAFHSLRAPSQPSNLEGQTAPAAQYRTITQTTNVVQIFHEKISTTYLAESNKAVSGVVPLPQGGVNGPVQNPRDPEFQVMEALATIAQDANYSFLNGTYVNPGDASTTALKTRGIMTAIVTNSIDKSGDATPNAAAYQAYVELLVMTLIQTTGYQPDETWTILAGVQEYSNIQAAYASKTTPPYDREVAGLKLRQIYTKFGILNLALEPDMPAQYFSILNFGVMGIVGLDVPGKGVLFEEMLAKVGSSNDSQIYGQMGIAHGPEYMAAKLKVPVVEL